MPYIDWTFFFTAWELKGRFPAILDDPTHGAAAREVYDHAQQLLKRIVDGKLIRARGVYGFWPASADGDDIVLYEPDGSRETGVGSGKSGDGNRQPDAANRRSCTASRCSGSRKSSPTASRTAHWPTSSRRVATRARRTTSARLP